MSLQKYRVINKPAKYEGKTTRCYIGLVILDSSFDHDSDMNEDTTPG